MADLEPHALQNYSSLCQRLEQRFGPGEEAETFCDRAEGLDKEIRRKLARIGTSSAAPYLIGTPGAETRCA